MLAIAAIATPPIVAGGAALWLLDHPEHIGPLVCWAAGWPEGSVVVADVSVGRRVAVSGLEIRPPQPRAPEVLIDHVDVDWPDPWRLRDHVVHLGDVRAAKVEIAAPTQGGRKPPGSGGWSLQARTVQVDDASFHAPATDVLQAVAVDGIQATMADVRWHPKARQFHGTGSARIASMDLGALDLAEVHTDAITLTGSDLELGPTGFLYGRTEALAEGRIAGIDRTPAVDLKVRLAGSRVEKAIEDATGRPSPLMGWLTSQVTVTAGGDLPPGGASISGWVQLTDAQVFAGDSMKLIPKVLLDIAPWFQRGEEGWVSIGNLRGDATFGRGWVELERLERASDKHRVLQAWGELKEGSVDMTVRAVPKRNASKPGVGVRLLGPIGEAKLKVATRDHLRTAPQ